MDDNHDVSPTQPDQQICSNCRQEPALEGYPNPFCANCRNNFIKYPIPKWIYGFGAIILLVMALSIIRIPPYIHTAIEFGKAQNAMKAHKYFTAQNHLKTVLQNAPAFNNGKASMFIAAAYNFDVDVARQMFTEINGVNVDIDEDLETEARTAMNFVSAMLANDTTIGDRLEAASKDNSAGLLRLFQEVDSSAIDIDTKLMSEYRIADRFYDWQNFDSCKLILNRILLVSPTHYAALQLMAATDRHLKLFDEGLAYCDKILQLNRENVNAIFLKARIELVRKNFTKAAAYRKEIATIAPGNIGCLEIDAVLAQSAGDNAKAKTLLAQIKTIDDSEQMIYKRMDSVINGNAPYN